LTALAELAELASAHDLSGHHAALSILLLPLTDQLCELCDDMRALVGKARVRP
jgi:hypothetical protein